MTSTITLVTGLTGTGKTAAACAAGGPDAHYVGPTARPPRHVTPGATIILDDADRNVRASERLLRDIIQFPNNIVVVTSVLPDYLPAGLRPEGHLTVTVRPGGTDDPPRGRDVADVLTAATDGRPKDRIIHDLNDIARVLQDPGECSVRSGIPAVRDGTIGPQEFVDGYVHRVYPLLARVEDPSAFAEVMRAAAENAAAPPNQTALSKATGVPQPTVYRYLKRLVDTHMCVPVPPIPGGSSRTLRTPKLYWADTALAVHLAEPAGLDAATLENVILQSLMIALGRYDPPTRIEYWQESGGAEVTFVLRQGDDHYPAVVTTSASPDRSDADAVSRYLRTFGGGPALVIHTGHHFDLIDENIVAVPAGVLL